MQEKQTHRFEEIHGIAHGMIVSVRNLNTHIMPITRNTEACIFMNSFKRPRLFIISITETMYNKPKQHFNLL
jgi:hypothetical protein